MITGWARNWGATADEARRAYPADDLLQDPVERLTRAVTVQAPASVTYRWLCQVALAPYSYDWLDNWGRQSPQQLTPGVEDLRVGQTLMVFTLTEISPGHQYTGHSTPSAERIFGKLAATYAVEPLDSENCRLICRLALGSRGVGATLLAWGDFIMMRRQLLNLKKLAERDAATLAAFGAMKGV
jgi:hypothetical protein